MGEALSELRGRLARHARLRAAAPAVPEGVTVLEAVRIGRSAQLDAPLPARPRTTATRSTRAMERAGVDAFADRRLTTLSGGELQRVQIAVGSPRRRRC